MSPGPAPRAAATGPGSPSRCPGPGARGTAVPPAGPAPGSRGGRVHVDVPPGHDPVAQVAVQATLEVGQGLPQPADDQVLERLAPEQPQRQLGHVGRSGGGVLDDASACTPARGRGRGIAPGPGSRRRCPSPPRFARSSRGTVAPRPCRSGRWHNGRTGRGSAARARGRTGPRRTPARGRARRAAAPGSNGSRTRRNRPGPRVYRSPIAARASSCHQLPVAEQGLAHRVGHVQLLDSLSFVGPGCPSGRDETIATSFARPLIGAAALGLGVAPRGVARFR